MKIVVVASHSGGHICPAVAFCQGLREREGDADITFVTTDGEIERKFTDDTFNPLYYKREKLTIFTAYKLIFLFMKANELFLRLQPDLVAGFGGYLSIPFILAAYYRKIPSFIHEQNVTLGRANRFLTRFATKIIVSFPQSNSKATYKEKTLVVGLPLRKELKKVDKQQARRYFGFDAQKFILLVVGGSQGSMTINGELVKVLKEIDSSDIGIIHSTGFLDYERILKEYKDIKLEKRVVPFIERMDYAMSACDLMISRAGAGTIAEIIFMKVPAVLIPYPHAKQHQLDNARFLGDNDAALVMKDQDFDAQILKKQITQLKNNRVELVKISKSLEMIPALCAREELAAFACGVKRWSVD